MALLPRLRLALVAMAFSAFAPALLAAAAPEATLQEGLAGVVKASKSPISEAKIYAYRVADPALLRVTSDVDGTFLFEALPAGVYKVIAHKPGFVPAVVLLTRAARTASDFLEFELVAERDEQYTQDDDFWSVRRKIPGDVLRDIRVAEAVPTPDEKPAQTADVTRDQTQVDAQMTAGYLGAAPGTGLRRLDSDVGVSSDMGGTQIDLRGNFQQLQPGTLREGGDGDFRGRSASVAMNVDTGNAGVIRLATLQHDMNSSRVGHGASVGFERYQASWSQQIDERSQSNVSLMYIDESNFNRQAMVTPVYIPFSSTSIQLTGDYSRELTDRVDLRTGISYREFVDGDFRMATGYLEPGQMIDAYGVSLVRFGENLQVEYGLYSSMRGDETAFSPHTGFVAQFAGNWTANAVVRHRMNDIDPHQRSFALARFDQRLTTPGSEDHYYEIGLSRRLGDSEVIEVGLVHRGISDTLRVMFDEDFFNQVESLYLVQGDEIPELRVALSQRLSNTVLTRFQTAFGDGGGGVFTTGRRVATNSENQIRYLVASLDTRFQNTDTGLLLAFHRVEQSLLGLEQGLYGTPLLENGMERMRLRVTQELGYFLDLESNWAVLLDLELTRGATPFTRQVDTEELRKQVAGGVAVKF